MNKTTTRSIPRLTANQKRILSDLPGRGREWGDYTIYRATHRTLRSLCALGLAYIWNDRYGCLLARRTVEGERLAAAIADKAHA